MLIVCYSIHPFTVESLFSFLTGKYWLHQALSCLSSSLERIGCHLVFIKAIGERNDVGSSLHALRELIKVTGARTVLANALYEPWLKDRDDTVVSALQKDGVECKMHHSYCLRDPYSVSTQGVGLRGKSLKLIFSVFVIILRLKHEYVLK